MAFDKTCSGACHALGGASITERHLNISGTVVSQTSIKPADTVGAALCSPVASQAYGEHTIVGSPTAINGVVRMRLSTLLAATSSILTVRWGGADQAQVRFNQATNRLFLRFNGSDGADMGPVLAATDFFHLAYRVDVTNNPWTFDVVFLIEGGSWDDNGGTTVGGVGSDAVIFTQATAAVAATTLNGGAVRYGVSVVNTTGVVAWCAAGVQFSGADYPQRPHKNEIIRPSGDGTHNASADTDFLQNNTTAIDPGTTTSFDFINDDPITDETDRITHAAGASTEYLEHTWENPASAADAVGLELVQAVLHEATLTANHTVRIVDGASTVDKTLSYSNASKVYAGHQQATAPSGGAWTQAKLNAIITRFGFSSDHDPDPSLHAMLMELTYAVADPGGGGSSSFPPGLSAGVRQLLLRGAVRAALPRSGV